MKPISQASNLRTPWFEGFFWVMLSFIIAAIGWHLASGPLSLSSMEQPPSPVPPAAVSAPLIPRIQLPSGDVKVLPAGPEGWVEVTEFVQLSQQLNRPEQTPKDDLEILHTLLDGFRRSKAWTNKPASENEEFIAPLCGKNPFRLVFITSDHPALNERGQLLDRWGAPYHFHRESGDHLHIRSAGPDGALFTSDDIMDPSSEGV